MIWCLRIENATGEETRRLVGDPGDWVAELRNVHAGTEIAPEIGLYGETGTYDAIAHNGAILDGLSGRYCVIWGEQRPRKYFATR